MSHCLRSSIRQPPPARLRSGADLHVHTTHSDGGCSPCEVVMGAFRAGLSALAITDHDTVSGLEIARPEAARLGLELVAGVELTCEFHGREVHLLGHFIGDAAPLNLAMGQLRTGRSRRFEAMMEALRRQGLRVDLRAVRQIFPRAVPGRRHLAEYLALTRQVASPREAFQRFLAEGRPAWFPSPRLPVAEAIGLIRNSGGTAALAHPPSFLTAVQMRKLVAAGLNAIEVRSPGITATRARRFQRWAAEFGLVPIAGTDFHFPDRPGRWVGAITTGGKELEQLRQASRANPESECSASTVGSSASR